MVPLPCTNADVHITADDVIVMFHDPLLGESRRQEDALHLNYYVES